MNYTFNQLRIFLKVAQNQSITKASEELHLTQPAVSIQLKNFQAQFEIPLTEVINKKLYVTDFGKEIAAAAENILNEVYAINYKSTTHKGKLSGRLKISVVSTGKYVIPYFLSSFIKQHDAVELALDVTNKSRVVDSLEKNEVDFSLVSLLPENLKLNKIELIRNKLFLIGNREEKFDNKKYKPDLLEKIPLIYREEGSATRYVMENFAKEHRLSIRKKIELTSNEAVKQAVIAGLGYSIMPVIGIKNELLDKQLQIIPVIGLPIESNWNLIWLKDKKITPVAAAYIDFLQHQKENIIKEHFHWSEAY